MTLPAGDFIRRFLVHVLPNGFHRVRYFGFLSNCHRARKLEFQGTAEDRAGRTRRRSAADYRDRFEALTGQSLREFPLHVRTMVIINSSRGPKSATRSGRSWPRIGNPIA